MSDRDHLAAYKQLLENPVTSDTERARARVWLAETLQAAHAATGSWNGAARELGVSRVYCLTLRQLAGLPHEQHKPA